MARRGISANPSLWDEKRNLRKLSDCIYKIVSQQWATLVFSSGRNVRSINWKITFTIPQFEAFIVFKVNSSPVSSMHNSLSETTSWKVVTQSTLTVLSGLGNMSLKKFGMDDQHECQNNSFNNTQQKAPSIIPSENTNRIENYQQKVALDNFRSH